ncbi:hypothetical protein HHK36_007031 [Tetracentron sinense]|uniref:RING-type E3 ubiquitin transferase BRCA1 n=1 Tax=Tetracentron sinense TaxID=13715 RepID=A0A835DL93_TETSI|nr:hypothetical protein HHK36_007031 [Tetracentron sinense]
MEDESLEDEFAFHSNESEVRRGYTIRGMESVIATVSGYHGLERFKLIKLISQTGASYLGALTKSTTHLVCWKFEGRKYSLAKSFGTVIVSHRWFEDCMKEGKRVPERPYILQSGQQVGTLLWEVPLVGKKESLLTRKKDKFLSDRSNTSNDTRELEIDTGHRDTGQAVWDDSRLLSENLFPDLGTTNSNSREFKKNVVQKTSKQVHRSSSRYCSLEPRLFGLIRMEQEESSSYSSVVSGRQKRNVPDTVGSTTTAKPTCKGRRLLKKIASRDILESAVVDCEQVCFPTEDYNPLDSITATPNDSNDLTTENALMFQGTKSEDRFCNRGQNEKEGLEDVEEIKELNNADASNDSNLLGEDTSSAPTRTSQEGFSDLEETMNEELKDVGEFGQIARLPTSIELSCVICWTDFSSTRGVLPCGHRFCFSCIQGWADHMASRRMVSTCPLCKASFMSITKVDGVGSSDQKIYSQTIPYASSTTDIFMLFDQETPSFGPQSSLSSVCCECRCREPEDLLITCHLCRIRCVHSYCLDPPLVPWTCIHCRDLRMLYQHFR